MRPLSVEHRIGSIPHGTGPLTLSVPQRLPFRLSDSRARAKEEIPIELFFFQLWAGRQKLMT